VIPAVPGSTSPFSPGVPQTTPALPPTTATPTILNPTTTSSNGGLSGAAAIFIALGAIVVLVGISFFIWRDARRAAPVRAGAGDDGLGGTRRGSKAPPKSRKLSPAERRRRKRGRAR
jgi:hypothetical protein